MDIEKVLFELGIYPDLKGFEYIPEALELIRKDHRKMTAIYEIIANKHKTTGTSVERCIRHAFGRMNPEKPFVKQMFGECPRTNAALLFMMDYRLKKWEEGRD